MQYVSIDIETTGLRPEQDQILSIAAVVDGPEYREYAINDLPYFYAPIPSTFMFGHPAALAMNADLIAQIAAISGDSLAVAGKRNALIAAFSSFIRGHAVNGKVTVAGKNFGGFDLQFLKRFNESTCAHFRHRVLDPALLYAKPEDEFLPDMDRCIERFQSRHSIAVPPVKKHDALEDARWVVRLIRGVWGGELG